MGEKFHQELKFWEDVILRSQFPKYKFLKIYTFINLLQWLMIVSWSFFTNWTVCSEFECHCMFYILSVRWHTSRVHSWGNSFIFIMKYDKITSKIKTIISPLSLFLAICVLLPLKYEFLCLFSHHIVSLLAIPHISNDKFISLSPILTLQMTPKVTK